MALLGGRLSCITNLNPSVVYDVSKVRHKILPFAIILCNHVVRVLLQVKFTTDCPAQGNRNYIPVSDLYGRNFTDANGEFQLELSIGHVRTVYDTEFGVPTSLTSRLMHHHHQIQNHHNPAAGNALQHQYGTASPRGTKCKLETSYFTFGGFDWNLALYPHGVKDVSCKCPFFCYLFVYFITTMGDRKLLIGIPCIV